MEDTHVTSIKSIDTRKRNTPAVMNGDAPCCGTLMKKEGETICDMNKYYFQYIGKNDNEENINMCTFNCDAWKSTESDGSVSIMDVYGKQWCGIDTSKSNTPPIMTGAPCCGTLGTSKSGEKYCDPDPYYTRTQKYDNTTGNIITMCKFDCDKWESRKLDRTVSIMDVYGKQWCVTDDPSK